MNVNVGNGLRSVRDYARPRPSRVHAGNTSGDLPGPSAGQGAIAGAVQGLISGSRINGLSGALAGAISGTVGGYAGVAAGEKLHSFGAAIGVGSLTGAATAAAISAGTAAMFGSPISLPLTTGMAVLGGLTGAVGTLTGSRRAATRDSVYGGYLAGMMGEAYVGNPFLSIAGAAGAGIGGRAVTPAGRAVLGALGGAATGAVAGLPFLAAGLPEAASIIAASAVAGAVIGPIGATVGPAARQVSRNAQDDLTSAINRKLDPWLEKHPLGTGGKLAVGGALGALTIGPLGMLAPAVGLPALPSVAVTAGLGAAVGSVNVYRMLKKQESVKALQDTARLYAGQYPALKDVFQNPAPQPA